MALAVLQAGGEMVTGKFYRVSILSYAGNQLGICDFSFFLTSFSGAPAPVLGDLTYGVAVAMDPLWQDLMHSSATILGYIGRQLSPPAPRPLTGLVTSGSSGLNASDMLPTQTRGVIKLQTLLSGRGYRGRAFTPFVPSNYQQGTSPWGATVTFQGILQATGNTYTNIRTIVGTVSGATLQVAPVIYHKKTDTGTNVIGSTGSSFLATQRRSGNYGRPNSTAPF